MAIVCFEEFLNWRYEPLEHERESFTIRNDGAADWAIRKIRTCKEHIANLQKTAEEQISLIEEWMLDEVANEEKSVAYFTGLLDNYHRELYEQDPKRYKTLKLPNGVLKRVKSQPTFVRDDEELLRWLEERRLEQFVQRTAKPKWGELKKNVVVAGNSCVMPITGEVVEGVTVTRNEETFKVEVI